MEDPLNDDVLVVRAERIVGIRRRVRGEASCYSVVAHNGIGIVSFPWVVVHQVDTP